MKGAFSKSKGSTTSKTAARETVAKLAPTLFRDAVASVIAAGAFIGFSATRDGGTVVVTLLHNSDTNKAYAQTSDELKSILGDAVASVAPEEPPF